MGFVYGYQGIKATIPSLWVSCEVTLFPDIPSAPPPICMYRSLASGSIDRQGFQRSATSLPQRREAYLGGGIDALLRLARSYGEREARAT